jgi:hypothetical protein
VTRGPEHHNHNEVLMGPSKVVIPSTNWHDAAAHYFLSNYVLVDSKEKGFGLYACLPELLQSCPQSSLLHCTVSAVSMVTLSSRLDHPLLAVHAGGYYSNALQLLKHTLLDPKKACSNHCLMSILLLALYEVGILTVYLAALD